MKYYLHDSNAFNDEKITELFDKFGYEGLGLFYTFLEKIAAQEKPVKTSVLKSQLKVRKKLNKCWNFMESLGIICSNNGDSFNKQLLNYSESYAIKKEKNRERIYKWRENQKDAENVTHYESVGNAPKVKRSKVKRSKVNTNTLKNQDFSESEKVEKSVDVKVVEVDKNYSEEFNPGVSLFKNVIELYYALGKKFEKVVSFDARQGKSVNILISKMTQIYKSRHGREPTDNECFDAIKYMLLNLSDFYKNGFDINIIANGTTKIINEIKSGTSKNGSKAPDINVLEYLRKSRQTT